MTQNIGNNDTGKTDKEEKEVANEVTNKLFIRLKKMTSEQR